MGMHFVQVVSSRDEANLEFLHDGHCLISIHGICAGNRLTVFTGATNSEWYTILDNNIKDVSPVPDAASDSSNQDKSGDEKEGFEPVPRAAVSDNQNETWTIVG